LDKPAGQRGAKHSDAQPAVSQRLVVVGDRFVVDGDAEGTGDRQAIVGLR
jgi:hypothetical protein